MDDLYREVIIEHYKNPSYRGHLDPHDISFADNNPLCGDHIQVDLRVDNNGSVTACLLGYRGKNASISARISGVRTGFDQVTPPAVPAAIAIPPLLSFDLSLVTL